MKHVYNKKAEYITSYFNEINDEDIKKVHGDIIISNKFIELAKVVDNQIVELNTEEKELKLFEDYKKGAYKLKSNEIVEDNKVKEVALKDYEYIEDGVLKYNYEEKRNDLIKRSKQIENAEKVAPFEFKGYIQPNRELEDQTSLLKILSFMQITGAKTFDKWKMKDKEGHEHYVSLTIQEMMQLGQLMQIQTTTAMVKWSKIREQIKALTEEELKDYELPRE